MPAMTPRCIRALLCANVCAVLTSQSHCSGRYVAEAVVDGSTGYVVRDPRNVDEVAARLSTLLGDSAIRTAMGMAARARAVGEFDYSVLVARLVAVLQS